MNHEAFTTSIEQTVSDFNSRNWATKAKLVKYRKISHYAAGGWIEPEGDELSLLMTINNDDGEVTDFLVLDDYLEKNFPQINMFQYKRLSHLVEVEDREEREYYGKTRVKTYLIPLKEFEEFLRENGLLPKAHDENDYDYSL